MSKLISEILSTMGQVVLGKEEQIKLAVAALFAKGHLLIEDLPGMGKTTLAHSLAHVLGLKYQRVQFTSDLLPADVIGVSIFDREKSKFVFHEGPVFSQVLLADEINRTTPKTQSALLEAMEEGQVSIDRETRPLPKPFFVIATQNPQSQAGTYPLPESQLDRFLMKISLGYPSREAEQMLFSGVDPRARLKQIKAITSLEQIAKIQACVNDIKVSKSLLDYLQRLVDRTREDDVFAYGLSPRGAMAWLRSAKSWALIHGRDYVVPEDIQAVAPSVVGHRVSPLHGMDGGTSQSSAGQLVEHLLSAVDVVSMA